MSTVVATQNTEELENSSEKQYRIQTARADELEAIGREMVNTVRRINYHIARLRAIREELRAELRMAVTPKS